MALYAKKSSSVRTRGEQPIAGKVFRNKRTSSGFHEHHGTTGTTTDAGFDKKVYLKTMEGTRFPSGGSKKSPFKAYKVDNKIVFPGGGSPKNAIPKVSPRAKGGKKSMATGDQTKLSPKLAGY